MQVIEVYGGDGVPPKPKRQRGVKKVKKKNEKHIVMTVIDFKPDNVHFKNEKVLADRVVKAEVKAHGEIMDVERRITKVEQRWDKIFEELRGRYTGFSVRVSATTLVSWAALILAIVAVIGFIGVAQK